MQPQAYPVLEKCFNSTCKILFGEEIGPLREYEEWLSKYLTPATKTKSYLSGKETILTTTNYLPNSKFASFDEIDMAKKFEPLSINEIKDIDSIIAACNERFVYTGNIILGNSSNVELSSNVIDSHFVYKSNVVSESKYIALCAETRYSENCFGCYPAVNSSHIIKCGGGWNIRSFECFFCQDVRDCYYCSGVQSSSDCLFCFGVRSGSYRIGNLSLPKEKYAALKNKLLAEIVPLLKKDKEVFSVFEIVSEAAAYGKSGLKLKQEAESTFRMEPVETAFGSTSSILFGKRLTGIESYEKFLYKNVPRNFFAKSPLSGASVPAGGHVAHLVKAYNIGARLLNDREICEIGKTAMDEKSLPSLKGDIETLAKSLAPIAYANLDNSFGKNINIKDATTMIDSADCYNGSSFIKVKGCAYCHWPRESECIFGSSAVFKSAFCINCYYSSKLRRCFEADNCEDCSDGYFLHNCENVNDSMFCFNVKNMRNAIGNVPLAPDKYKSIKSAVLRQLSDELERKKDIGWSIYSIGAIKK